MTEKKKPVISDLSSSLLGLSLTAGIGSMLIGGMMDKMFGDRSEIPKGVVKEMMHGVMLGVQDMIAEKDYDIKELKDKLERKENDYNEVKEERDAIQRRYDELMAFAEDMKAKEKAKKKTAKKKK